MSVFGLTALLACVGAPTEAPAIDVAASAQCTADYAAKPPYRAVRCELVLENRSGAPVVIGLPDRGRTPSACTGSVVEIERIRKPPGVTVARVACEGGTSWSAIALNPGERRSVPWIVFLRDTADEAIVSVLPGWACGAFDLAAWLGQTAPSSPIEGVLETWRPAASCPGTSSGVRDLAVAIPRF